MKQRLVISVLRLIFKFTQFNPVLFMLDLFSLQYVIWNNLLLYNKRGFVLSSLLHLSLCQACLVIHSSSPLSHIFREYFSFSAISMVYYHREERSYKQLAVPSLQSICHRSSRFTLHLFTPVWEMEMKRDGGSSVCVNRWNSGHLCALGLCVSHRCVFWMCAGFEEDKQDYILRDVL